MNPTPNPTISNITITYSSPLSPANHASPELIHGLYSAEIISITFDVLIHRLYGQGMGFIVENIYKYETIFGVLIQGLYGQEIGVIIVDNIYNYRQIFLELIHGLYGAEMVSIIEDNIYKYRQVFGELIHGL